MAETRMRSGAPFQFSVRERDIHKLSFNVYYYLAEIIVFCYFKSSSFMSQFHSLSLHAKQ